MIKTVWMCAVVCASAMAGHATQYTYSDSGGTVTQGTSLSVTGVAMANPAGTLSMSCPLSSTSPVYPYYSEWTCIGGGVSFQSTDGQTTFSGYFPSATFALKKSGNFPGQYTYSYSLFGTVAGSLTINGHSRAVLGSVMETLVTLNTYLGTGTIQSGTFNFSQQYEPAYIADTGNNRIVQIADILGDNWTALGQAGRGLNQFSQPSGLAMDSAHKIYISDRGNCRIVRMDNISGANWTSFGSCGAGSGQFSNPSSVAVDASGAIYVADTGNSRVVRMDDMTGAGFTPFGGAGSGTGQFSSPGGMAVDAAGKIYVADTGNLRIVRVDDIGGSNWTEMNAATGHFYVPSGVYVDSSLRVFVFDSEYSFIVRSDDLTGANPAYLGLNAGEYFLNPGGMYIDPDGAVYVADTGNSRVVRSFDFTGTNWTPLGTAGSNVGMFSSPSSVIAVSTSKPVPLASASPASLTFPIVVIGSSSAEQSVLVSNIGTAPYQIGSITTAGNYQQTNDCPATLAAGQTCTCSVTFSPAVGGTRPGALQFSLSGAKLKSVPLSGAGVGVSVYPSYINFDQEHISGSVTVTNPGPRTVSVTSLSVQGPPQVFYPSTTCHTPLAPGASCTVTVTFFPKVAGNYGGELIITDSMGGSQPISMVGLL